jgi:hypothetical protein
LVLVFVIESIQLVLVLVTRIGLVLAKQYMDTIQLIITIVLFAVRIILLANVIKIMDVWNNIKMKIKDVLAIQMQTKHCINVLQI